ncbi:MAG: hypothetical protein Satyrvirus9_7 [Satyrvirus sp.]|uniref:Thioredoxin-like fold n=1 Tax=Satyrvirus sp. TaxID=2487771 RepID=A0A3G5AG70_9VIRU|nr:MAG: hypothetical protein Satyrvirus9_7 [Satyrvirus sp.]
MENFYKITNSRQLNKTIENSKDRLIVIMYYTKNNSDCRKALVSFEKSAHNHTTSIFCVVDVDNFEGDSQYINNINNFPKFECYYLGNSFGSFSTSNEKEIESGIRSGEQYVMTQNNMKNNYATQHLNPNPNPNPMSQINYAQIQQYILNTAQMQNPTQYQYLLKNPTVLQQEVNRQMQMLQPQQLQQLQQPQQPQQPQQSPQQFIQPTFPQQQFVQPQIPVIPYTMSQPVCQNQQDVTSILPTFQQMQQMFQIFQMMQQMGILNTSNQPVQPVQPVANSINSTDPGNLNKNILQSENEIILPSGDKIIPLSNGKYGLVKKTSQ